MEPKIRDLISEMISRGKVNLFVSFDENISEQGKSLINRDVSKALYSQLSKLKKELKISGDITINDLLLIPEVTKPAINSLDEKEIWLSLEKVMRKALTALVAMRKKEGTAILKDMKMRLKFLDTGIKSVEKLSSDCVLKYREKLSARLQELFDTKVDESVRVEEEIALLAEKTDITEECTRFHSHVKQYSLALSEKKPVGKKLNFILQELNREANTIASKCADISISSTTIKIKEEIEKLREQVQNIE